MSKTRRSSASHGSERALPGASASAPGKVILFGEHFVVKGARSIATAIGARVTVHIAPVGEPIIDVDSPEAGIRERMPLDLLLSGRPGRLAPLAGIIEYFHRKYGIEPHGLLVRVRSGLPVGAGLGSSAAFSAAFSLAYARLHGLSLSRRELFEASMIGERIAHGNPSGIDSAIAVGGGSILYRRGEEPRSVHLALPRRTVLLVADTGVGRSTREVVERVLRRAELSWAASEHIYRAADALVDLALEAFRRGDARLLGELMDINQGLLASMGASSLVIERILYAMRDAGALGAKLTGAGWGGCVIALAYEGVAGKVMEAARRAGARRVFRASIGAEGARLEE